ncbi:uncharacterized protein PRCAT00004711001 [Priceomyces carsonii]|uniref:uncharacterized protein n=1 Tax=Priceomyces carsonii TaxID=28549 RepID=UPI002EDA5C97|nr:unnamed protein product [Priceomyces carsonii]
MTIIIGSLFLPYTVHFEVGSHSNFDIDVTRREENSRNVHEKAQSRSRINVSASKPINSESQGSIIPSLSLANSRQQTPMPEYRSTRSADVFKRPGIGSLNESARDSGEDFFYKHKLQPSSSSSQLNLSQENEKSQPQYIQPKSRYSNLKVESSVVDPKKESADLGLPALKINRSATNLGALGQSKTTSFPNLTSLNSNLSIPSVRNKGSVSKQSPSFTLNNNGSSSSVAIAEDQDDTLESDVSLEDDEWKNDFNNMVHGRSESKLAPFGGFSKPDIEEGLFNHNNIFETAPWNVAFAKKGNISLTKAVRLSVESDVIKSRLWVGTLAMPSDAVPEKVTEKISKRLQDEYSCEPVFPDDFTFQGHYKSFCKHILWPTLHYQIPDDPKSKAFEDHSWGQYWLLNQLVADKIVEVYKKVNGKADPNDPENMIWIHDYHLLLVPKMVREKLPNAKIGFFLHVSFPSSEVFRCLPQREALLKGMLGANCISFQTDEYVRHFLQTCNRLLLADTNQFGVSYEGRFTMTNTIPVGINAKSLFDLTKSKAVLDWSHMIRERWPDQKLIVSRDKLDKLRGIKQKLLAYERFLKDNPEYIETVVFIQICIGTSADPGYESEIMQIVGRINSLTENISDTPPILFLQKDLEFEQYLALLCEADVFVVSSMREGLNLTCHEFITSTYNKKSPLILSEFTGSSPLLYCNGKGALLINPWDIKAFSITFKRLLTMNPGEKLERWSNCSKIVNTHDSKNWVSTCLKSINLAWNREQCRNISNLTHFTGKIFNKFYSMECNGKRLFILSLEVPTEAIKELSLGITTTTPIVNKGSSFSDARLLLLLSDLLSDPKNHIYIVSVLKRSDLERIYRRAPNLGLIAENGGYIKLVGSSKWISIVDESELNSWMSQAIQLIESKVERLPGSFCEIEDCTVRFHAGSSFIDDRERSLDAMGDCIQHINELFQEKDGVHATLIKNLVVVQQNQLALKAVKFLMSYYNRDKLGLDSQSLIKEYKVKNVPSSSSHSPPSSAEDNKKALTDQKSITLDGACDKKLGLSAIFLSGASTPIVEPCFEYVTSYKGISAAGKITVAILDTETKVRTSANYAVLGKNELLSILSSSTLT